jgi:hypothetical protein
VRHDSGGSRRSTSTRTIAAFALHREPILHVPPRVRRRHEYRSGPDRAGRPSELEGMGRSARASEPV